MNDKQEYQYEARFDYMASILFAMLIVMIFGLVIMLPDPIESNVTIEPIDSTCIGLTVEEKERIGC